tara:strand:+ start:24236 stop:24409 length:174 start_codon:yes stop_codon:yes gene_type:complete
MATSATQDDYAKTALRLPRDLHRAVHEAAKQQDRSFNGQIVALLRAALAPVKQGASQ